MIGESPGEIDTTMGLHVLTDLNHTVIKINARDGVEVTGLGGQGREAAPKSRF